MAIGISSVTVGTNTGSTATVSVTTSESPVTTKSGDLVVVVHGNDYYDLTNMATPTATGSPTLTSIGSADGGSLQGHIKAWWYKANTAGAQTISDTETGGAGEEKFLIACVLSGADTTSPVDGTPASNVNNTSGSTSPVCNGITVTNSDSLVFECIQSGGGSFSSSYTAPAGTTKRWDTNVGTGSCGGGTVQLSSLGATGNYTWTAAGNHTYVSLTFAIKTAAAGSPSLLVPSGAVVRSCTW